MLAAEGGFQWGEIGPILTGLAALLGVIAAFRAEGSRRETKRLMEASPHAVIAEIREENNSLRLMIDAQMARWTEDRKSLERAVMTWRSRAESAEAQNLRIAAELTGVRIDMAMAKSQVHDLEEKVDRLINRRPME